MPPENVVRQITILPRQLQVLAEMCVLGAVGIEQDGSTLTIDFGGGAKIRINANGKPIPPKD